MKLRPIRPNIYLPVVKFGVVASDWKFVIASALIGYTLPFLFDLKLWGVPAELLLCIFCAVFAVAFFNFVRIGRRPYWLQHKLKALIENPVQRRILPTDITQKPNRLWIAQRTNAG